MYDIVVVGAGLHALTFLCTLLEQSPMAEELVDAVDGVVRSRLNERTMRKRMLERAKKTKESIWKGSKILVIDKHGKWLENWKKQFEVLGIEALRSNASLHPDPIDPEMLFEFARMQGYSIDDGFEEITDIPRGKQFVGPFQLPKATLFNDFCEYLIDSYKLRDVIFAGDVKGIVPYSDDGCSEQRLCYKLDVNTGDKITCRRIVIAIGHTNLPRIPDWVDTDSWSSSSVVHVWDMIHRSLPDSLENTSIAIIGGGLTAVQLVRLAVTLNCSKVTLICRKPLRVRQFDSDLTWSGKLRHNKLSTFWKEPDMEKRLQSIRAARQGGTITKAARELLFELRASGYCNLLEEVEVWSAEWDTTSFCLELSCGDRLYVDRIWLATGSEPDINNEPLLADILVQYPVTTFNGYPVLDDGLRLHTSLEVYVIGAYASLALGPDGVNLAGARRAAFRLRNEIHASL